MGWGGGGETSRWLARSLGFSRRRRALGVVWGARLWMEKAGSLVREGRDGGHLLWAERRSRGGCCQLPPDGRRPESEACVVGWALYSRCEASSAVMSRAD